MVEKLFVDHVVVPRTRALVSQFSDDHSVYESERDKALYLGGLRDGYKLRQLLEEMDR